MPRYSNDWWDKAKAGFFKPITLDDIRAWINDVKDDNDKLPLVLEYYTGARPSELCLAKWKDLEIDGDNFKMFLQTLKKGKNRVVWFPINDVTGFILDLKIRSSDNEFILGGIKRWNLRDKIYKVTKREICPYILRHNIYSKMAVNGIPPHVIMEHKGSKRYSSVESYIHINKLELKKIASELD